MILPSAQIVIAPISEDVVIVEILVVVAGVTQPTYVSISLIHLSLKLVQSLFNCDL